MQFLKLASCSFPAAAAAAAALTYQLFIDLQLFGSRCSRNYWVISAMTVDGSITPQPAAAAPSDKAISGINIAPIVVSLHTGNSIQRCLVGNHKRFR